MKFNKKFFINISLFIFSSLIYIFISELTLRKIINFNKGSQVNYFNKDEIISGLRLGKANEKITQTNNRGDFKVKVQFNNLGLRDKRDLRLANEESYIVVGDSFTFGFGVEEDKRFSNLLLNNYGLDIYNLGIPNNLYGYEALIKYSYILGAKSNNLILVICMENDLFKNQLTNKLNNKNFRSYSSQILKHPKKFLTNNSAIYFSLSSLIHKNQKLADLFIRLGFIKPILEDQNIANLEVLFDNDLNKTSKFIKRISTGFKSYIVIIPSRYNWHKDILLRKKVRKEHDLFVNILKSKDLKVIDLRKSFERNSKNPLKELHFKFDGHWNEIGHLVKIL